MRLCGSLSILWHCLSLGLEWKLTFSSPMATAEFSKFADILSAALSQHHLLGFAIAQLEFHHFHLALFIVMLPKAHFTSHSRMSGSRWVITPLWLSAYSLLKRGVWSLSIGLRTGLEQQSPILLAPGTSFMEDKFSLDEGREECGFGMIQVHLHLLCTLFLLLLHQLHPRSSGIRSQSLQPPGLYGIQWRAQSLTSRMSSLKGGAFPFPRLIELLVMPFLVAQW